MKNGYTKWSLIICSLFPSTLRCFELRGHSFLNVGWLFLNRVLQAYDQVSTREAQRNNNHQGNNAIIPVLLQLLTVSTYIYMPASSLSPEAYVQTLIFYMFLWLSIGFEVQLAKPWVSQWGNNDRTIPCCVCFVYI